MADIRQAVNLAPTDTVAYFRAKDYATQAHWDELWQQEHARAFTVTKMLDGDLLAKVRASLDDVLAKGGTFEQWRDEILPTLKAHDWWGKVPGDLGSTGVDHEIFVGEGRLRTIYDTNLRTARAAGRWQRIQATKKYQPYLMYDAVRDSRTRPLHRLWGGLDDGKPIILPADHPAWSVYFPPCGWGCRCGVIQMSERDLARRGLSVTTDEELIAKGWITASGQVGGKRTPYQRTDGTIEMVPAGIDPGFGYNPGEHFFAALKVPPVDRPLAQPHILAPTDIAPPPPRVRDASILLDPATPPDEATRQFLAHFDAIPTDGETLLAVDKAGRPIAVSPDLFIRRPQSSRAGASKLSPERIEAINLLAETLADPDEIWTFWDEWPQRGKNPPGRRLVRRYVARFEIEGRTQRYLVIMDYGEGGWRGLSAYPKEKGDEARVRGGTLVYRRT